MRPGAVKNAAELQLAGKGYSSGYLLPLPEWTRMVRFEMYGFVLMLDTVWALLGLGLGASACILRERWQPKGRKGRRLNAATLRARQEKQRKGL